MQCHCGGETRDHEVQEKGIIVARYAQCVACGRIHWWWDERNAQKSTDNNGKNSDDDSD